MGDQEGKSMAQEAKKFDAPDSEKVSERRSDAYVVLNLLPPERLAWLREQSLRVAEVFHRAHRSQ